jgi:origin recognition complex subunit 4
VAFDQLTALVKQFFTQSIGKKQSQKRYLIFLLEDLEKFAAHPQQNLLYCLFELALSLPVYVIGTSCRIDVLELLEKRVKSRFSQNIVYLPLPDSREMYIDRIKANLMAPFCDKYNEAIEAFTEHSKLFKDLCDFNFDFTKDVRPVFNALLLTFVSIATDQHPFDWDTFEQRFEASNGSSRPELSLNSTILEVTMVELMIIVAMCRLASKFTSVPVTFDVMTEELATCKLRAPGLENFVWTKSTLQSSFDRLISCRLLITSSNTSSSTWQDRSYLTVRLGLPHFVVIDSIEKHPRCSKEIFSLACERF